MNVPRPAGEPWRLRDVAAKLDERAGLPGAFVFDRAASASRNAKEAGVSIEDRLALALPASWLVNSPAISRVLRRWSVDPQREVWLALVEELEAGAAGPTEGADRDQEIMLAVHALGSEPYIIEAVSKVLAILVPDVVPLMPPPARVFVLGEEKAADLTSFIAMIDWFTDASATHAEELAALARAHTAAPLSGAQVLDRMLWFDSEGHTHFAAKQP